MIISRGLVLTVDRAFVPEDACTHGLSFQYRIPDVFRVTRDHFLDLIGFSPVKPARVLSYRDKSALIRVELETSNVKVRRHGDTRF